MQVGVAGLGKMGAAIAARLVEVGHHVAVWNRTPDKAKPLVAAGAKVAASPGELANICEAVITILTDAAAIDTVYCGANGLLSGNATGKLFIDMSTVRPETEVALATKVRAKAAVFVECPVGGTVGPARQGKLLGLMGADAADGTRAKPLLDQLCRRLEHCGPVGTGSSMKLAINLPLMIAWQAYGEAFAICRDVGFAPSRLVDLFSDISATNNAFKARAPMIVTLLEGGDPGPTTFDIASAVKDLKTMQAEGNARGVELPLLESTLACFAEANRAGYGDQDGAAIPAFWAQRGKASREDRK
jgi:3-hydroxyisobutyrate dehydrogenase